MLLHRRAQARTAKQPPCTSRRTGLCEQATPCATVAALAAHRRRPPATLGQLQQAQNWACAQGACGFRAEAPTARSPPQHCQRSVSGLPHLRAPRPPDDVPPRPAVVLSVVLRVSSNPLRWKSKQGKPTVLSISSALYQCQRTYQRGNQCLTACGMSITQRCHSGTGGADQVGLQCIQLCATPLIVRACNGCCQKYHSPLPIIEHTHTCINTHTHTLTHTPR